MNASWFSIKKEEKDITLVDCEIELSKKIEELSIENKNMSSTIQGMSSKMEDMSSTIETMSSIIDALKHKFSIIEVENLKLINRILEAEISLERTKNILVRKHISFPFISTLLSNRFL